MSTHVSGKDGSVKVGVSTLPSVRKWSFDFKSNNPQFATSDAPGHKVSVAGVKSGTVNFEAVLDTDNVIYTSYKPGQLVTLLLHENASRYWTVPVRIEGITGECDINDGGELVVPYSATTYGAWTYPDGTLSS